MSVGAAAMAVMQAHPTDNPEVHRRPNPLPLTGVMPGQLRVVCALARHRRPRRPGRSGGLPVPVGVMFALNRLYDLLTSAPANNYGRSINLVSVHLLHHAHRRHRWPVLARRPQRRHRRLPHGRAPIH